MMVDADGEAGRGKARPVSYAALGEAERGVIDQAFEAFAWRARPSAIVSSWHLRTGSKEAAEALLAGVAPRGLDDDRFDAAFPDRMITISTTPEGMLYYMPTVLSRCVRETESDRLAHDVLGLFRSRPYNLDWPISAWPRFMDAAAGDEDALADPHVAEEVDECGRGFLMETTRYWLMVTAPDRAYGHTWHDTLHLVAQMTPAERQALVAFFSHLATTSIWGKDRSIVSANALLTGRGVMDVLLIRTAAECIEIADALQALETRHPSEFPPHDVAPVKNLLWDIAAGRRSPDTTLGW